MLSGAPQRRVASEKEKAKRRPSREPAPREPRRLSSPFDLPRHRFIRPGLSRSFVRSFVSRSIYNVCPRRAIERVINFIPQRCVPASLCPPPSLPLVPHHGREAFESTAKVDRDPVLRERAGYRYAVRHKCIFRVRHEAKNSPLISRRVPALSRASARDYPPRVTLAVFSPVDLAEPASICNGSTMLRSCKYIRGTFYRFPPRTRTCIPRVHFPCSSVDFGR